jgi:hypothetical protein
MKTIRIQRLGSALRLLVCICLIISPLYPLQGSQLVLTSARADVGPGDERLFLGFTIDGPGDLQVGLVAVGPSLEPTEITDPLTDPRIILIDTSTGDVIDANDDWRDHPSAALSAEMQRDFNSPLADTEPAMVLRLPADHYTLIVEGKEGETGIALAAVIDRSDPPMPGTWRGEGVCFHLAPDSEHLTSVGSTCDRGASLRIAKSNPNAGCFVLITSSEDIPIVKLTNEISRFSISKILGDRTELSEGTFTTSESASGTAALIDGGFGCSVSWTAEPDP